MILKCDTVASSMRIPWELLRNAGSQAYSGPPDPDAYVCSGSLAQRLMEQRAWEHTDPQGPLCVAWGYMIPSLNGSESKPDLESSTSLL